MQKENFIRVLSPFVILLIAVGNLRASQNDPKIVMTPPIPGISREVGSAENYWTQLFAFGDSFSDSGSGYVDGNGPTAIVYAARELNIPFTFAGDPDAGTKGRNYAVSGARTGYRSSKRVKTALLEYGMQNQVEDFVAAVRSGTISFDTDRTLFFLAGGLNDKFLETAETMANVTRLVERLSSAGARHIFIANLPAEIDSFSAVANRLNPHLEALPSILQDRIPAARIRGIRWGAFFDAVKRNPAQYGIVNTTDACAGREIFDEETKPRGDPATYYFYHNNHPSTATHQHVGKMLAKEFRHAAAELLRRNLVFLLGGQSNMVGQGLSSELEAPYQNSPEGVLFWLNGWVPLSPGFGNTPAHFGPEVAFGRSIRDAIPNDRIYLVKYGSNGKSLYQDFEPYRGRYFLEMMETYGSALADLDKAGLVYEIAGMVWMQGESDAYESQADAYEANLTSFIEVMRRELQTPDLPFIIARVLDYFGGSLPPKIGEQTEPTQASIVRAAQISVAQKTPNVFWFDTDQFAVVDPGENPGHYGTQGQLALGKAFAEAILQITRGWVE
jgi:phospholipase/lecithinase/hemolysin